MGVEKAAERRERQMERFRRYGLVLLAAIVLLPPYLVGLLLLGLGGVYLFCIVVTRFMRMGDGGRSSQTTSSGKG